MKPIRYIGFLNEASGLGQSARSHLMALAHAGVPVQPRAVGLSPRGPVSFGLDTGTYPELATLANNEEDAEIELIHTMPHAAPLFASPKRRSIAVTVWETERLPRGWDRHVTAMDEVWVPSRFAARAFAATGVDVRVIPHPVESLESERVSLPDIPDDVFAFLSILEWQDRKNPEGIIRAFLRAFSGRRDVVLIMKVGTLFYRRREVIDEILDDLCSSLLRTPRVFLIQEHLSPATVRMLYRRADAYLSLHRAEGFGLCMAEAMAAERPVIATGYSGNMDFMKPDNAYLVGSQPVRVQERFAHGMHLDNSMWWAEPDLDEAIDLMRACVNRAENRRTRALAGARDVRAQLAPSRIGALMKDALDAR